MTREEMDYIGALNMCDEISNEAYQKIMAHCEEQQLCEDCISREEVRGILASQRDELIKLHTVNPKDNPKADTMAYGVNWSLNTLMELPSVTPQPKVGEWLKNGELCKCSRCGSLVLRSVIKSYNYCFRCGAKMEVNE